MSRTIMLVPTDTRVGLTSVSLGVIRSMEQKGVRLVYSNLSHSLVLKAH
nr:AAA family ATPase [Proteus mirabilis]